MCGICGSISLDGKSIEVQDIARMMDALIHRGPDGSGMHVRGPIGLGHRRLSIIDLGGGAQPMTNETGEIVLVFNGEIYNYLELRTVLEKCGHTFRTRSDTEVIVHGYEEWGGDAVKRFNGIFAFALWDAPAQRLLLARDHLGVKPLYYVSVDGKLLFASEIKALLTNSSCPREVDLSSLGQLFTFRYVPSPNTLFKDIKKLPPAHTMTLGRGGLEVKRYWDGDPQIDTKSTVPELIERYQYLIEDAVRLQMRSDVPVGLFLSSGVDSSALLALMSQFSSSPIHTFTIGFEGGERTNETDDARVIAARFGADHTERLIGPADYERYYERYLNDLEEPVGHESAPAFYFVSQSASAKVKVALCGQGADEPWAGYSRYIGARLSDLFCGVPKCIVDTVLRPVAFSLPRNETLKRGVTALGERDRLARFVKIYSFFRPEMKSRLFRDWVQAEWKNTPHGAELALSHLQQRVRHLDSVCQMAYIDTRASLPDDLLMVADKTSMANSLEARVPYLDYRVIEFIETVPSNLRLKWLQGKYLHKRALEKWVPKDIVYRKKKGFTNPMELWLRGRMHEYVNTLMLGPDSAVSKYFDVGYIKELIRLHQSRKENYTRHINLLLSFEMWHRRFIGQK